MKPSGMTFAHWWQFMGFGKFGGTILTEQQKMQKRRVDALIEERVFHKHSGLERPASPNA